LCCIDRLSRKPITDIARCAAEIKGTLHANRVKLNSTAVVEGDIFHRTLAIQENARFEGTSRRNKNKIDTPPRVQTNRPRPQAVAIDGNP
jgi:cytoskeletal protein CcmA (bactofilin family)